ncbi:MAG: lipopolysaccharide assembly protein LapA domain-containing protein [Halocynthiibacter sp.]
MRYVKYAFLAILGLGLITVALANRGTVTLRLLPDELSRFAGANMQIELPLFLVIFAGIVAGLLIGFVWEWLREHKHRSEAAQVKREAANLSREVSRLRDENQSPEDDVLTLLEESSATR